MARMHEKPEASRVWAITRILLGTLQTVAAMVALVVLAKTGVNELTTACVVITLLLFLISRYLFRKDDQNVSRGGVP